MCQAVLRPCCKHMPAHTGANGHLWVSLYWHSCLFMAWSSCVVTAGSNITCFWFPSHNTHLVWEILVPASCKRCISLLGLVGREEEEWTWCGDIHGSVYLGTAKCNPPVELARGADKSRNHCQILQGARTHRHHCLGALWAQLLHLGGWFALPGIKLEPPKGPAWNL